LTLKSTSANIQIVANQCIEALKSQKSVQNVPNDRKWKSGFTRVAARRVAQPPKAAFVTGLRHRRLPNDIACQLPDQTDYCLGESFLHWLFAPSGRSEFSWPIVGIPTKHVVRAKAAAMAIG
jgi:hypothetical protein